MDCILEHDPQQHDEHTVANIDSSMLYFLEVISRIQQALRNGQHIPRITIGAPPGMFAFSNAEQVTHGVQHQY